MTTHNDAKTKTYNFMLNYQQLVDLFAALAEAGKGAKDARNTRIAEGNTRAAAHDSELLNRREALLSTFAQQTGDPELEAAALFTWTIVVGEGGITPQKFAELDATHAAQNA
jgi:hypothetical protein